nr:LLM class F420-dependent oxidoreductase [Sphingomonas sp. CDS-1]
MMTISPPFRVGVVFPQLEIEADAAAIRDFGTAVEAMGYHHIIAYDHVVGANIRNRPGWNMPYTHESAFHEPLTLFSYLAACTRKILLSTGVIILPQRQTVLLAKQAANVDIFSGGRLRLGVGLGWNEVEYEALGIPFADRGARMDAQIALLRQLWTEESFTVADRHHHITDAGLCPLPIQRPIPIWIGGIGPAALRRVATLGDGWLPAFEAELAEEKVQLFRDALTHAGRPDDGAEMENIIFLGNTIGGSTRGADDAVKDVEIWRQAGVAGVAIHSMGMGLKGVDQHLRLFEDIAGMLGLPSRSASE